MHRFSLNLLDIDIDLDALAKNSMIPYIGINDDNFFFVFDQGIWSRNHIRQRTTFCVPFKPESKPNYFFIRKSSVDFSSTFSKLSDRPKRQSIFTISIL